MNCHKCKKREATHDVPDIWCTVCWADWWFLEETDDYNEEDLALAKKERIEFLRNEGSFVEN